MSGVGVPGFLPAFRRRGQPVLGESARGSAGRRVRERFFARREKRESRAWQTLSLIGIEFAVLRIRLPRRFSC